MACRGVDFVGLRYFASARDTWGIVLGDVTLDVVMLA